MKQKLIYSLLFGGMLLLSSCAQNLIGVIYTSVMIPTAATSNEVGTKVGKSQAMSILGIYAGGDASIDAAAKDGNIKKISHVDTERFGVLGIYYRQTTMVYGN
jgi:hypothetical protein